MERHGDGAPVIGLIHGGYWRDRYGLELMDGLAVDLAARGYGVVNAEYRRLGEGVHWPTLLDDVLAAVAGCDALVGHSAGGHLALLAGPRLGVPVVAQAPVADLRSGLELSDGAVGLLLGGDLTLLGEASPIEQLPSGVPVLVLHGDADSHVPISQSIAYHGAAAMAGDDVEFVRLPGDDHFVHIDPTSQAWRAVVEWLDGRLR